MRDFGFQDFEKNLSIARKHKGQIEIAVAELTDLDGQNQGGPDPSDPVLQKYETQMNRYKWDLTGREVMTQLYQMGFTDFDKNYASAQKHKFDLNSVLNELGF